MDMMAGLQVSFSALNAQRTRMNVIASNLVHNQATFFGMMRCSAHSQS